MNGTMPAGMEANEKFYQELLKHYTVTIEKPEPRRSKQVAAEKVK